MPTLRSPWKPSPLLPIWNRRGAYQVEAPSGKPDRPAHRTLVCSAVLLGATSRACAFDRPVASQPVSAGGPFASGRASAARPSTHDYVNSAIQWIERSEIHAFAAKQPKNTCDHLLITSDDPWPQIEVCRVNENVARTLLTRFSSVPLPKQPLSFETSD